jgi:hypothetical protein
MIRITGSLPLKKGMPVNIDDGWRGKIDDISGDIVVCIRDGEGPNDDRLRGYRFNPRALSIKGRSRTARVAVVDPKKEERARLFNSWLSAPAD